MITRRSFLAALCALPVIGKYVPKPKAKQIERLYFYGDGYGNGGIKTLYTDGTTEEESYGDPWPENTRAERIKAGLPVI